MTLVRIARNNILLLLTFSLLSIFSWFLLPEISLFPNNNKMSSLKKISIKFKVFGKVQGVFFRKFTKSKAEELSLVGWVMNENDGTVVGSVQGPEDKIKIMKTWLSTEGSPYGRVDRCEFLDEKVIDHYEFESFKILH